MKTTQIEGDRNRTTLAHAGHDITNIDRMELHNYSLPPMDIGKISNTSLALDQTRKGLLTGVILTLQVIIIVMLLGLFSYCSRLDQKIEDIKRAGKEITYFL